ncbi:GH3 family domain-containing protein [Geomesophilobacter sediminis]|uniref:GH3 auxin-responsive promoter family protein n=1 Tax=Geomesophilobacter sediminis TaxID=2798584 RepID=A0A8J7LYB2_9BACT|nr:GH3 auxin-responsive promoter family protein [Geomesophilobacter sediminis]MBJ6724462.1 GH3 auxin-responsive promoter family protein [Geomesophilobacter sediminis]
MTTALLRDATFPLFDRFLKGGASLVAERFTARDPFAAQREIFRDLLRRGAETRFGRDYGFADLASLPFKDAYPRYRFRVPIRSYADFWNDYFSQGWSEAGERRTLHLENVTWPGKIPFFCETSGTTAPSKFIPFSNEMFAANRRAALDMVCGYLDAKRRSRLFQGRLLYMAGNTELSDLGLGVKSGDMSAITLRYRPAALKPFIAPDAATAALPWDEKLEAMARLLLNDPSIRGISGVPPWILLLLKRVRELGGEPLEKLLPGLELIIHGGTSLKPYASEFAALFPGAAPQFLELLPSSEAFMGFQLPGEELMRLTPYYGVFFEFVPVEALDERGGTPPDAPAVPLEQIEVGRRYAVILTTCAGLWRYHIGDTIRFRAKDPLFIEFTGRDRFLDRFEEKVTQGEVEEAVARLNRLSGVEVREFMVGPDIAARRHLWVLALRDGERAPHCEILARELDGVLRELNADYATFRAQGRIAAPAVVPVGEELIYRWSKEVRGKLGGQSKIPHIDPTLEGELVVSLVGYAAPTLQAAG